MCMYIYIYIVFYTHPNLIISCISYQHIWCANVSDHLSSKACPSTVSAAVSGAKPSPGTTPPGASTRRWRPARPRRRGWQFNVYWISVNLYIYTHTCTYIYICIYIYMYIYIYLFMHTCWFIIMWNLSFWMIVLSCFYIHMHIYIYCIYIYICICLHYKIVKEKVAYKNSQNPMTPLAD